MKRNILLLKGGQSAEHEVSLVSAEFFKKVLKDIPGSVLFEVLLTKEGEWLYQGRPCYLGQNSLLYSHGKNDKIDFAIPCLHGYPGETGHIQALFELYGVSYLGPKSEASQICFNKVSTKLWLNTLNIPNCEFTYLVDQSEESYAQAQAFFSQVQGDVFVKASCQGSSRGCYHVTEAEKLKEAIDLAFTYSRQVLIEQTIRGRELEVAVFEYQGEVHTTLPGEIYCPSGFYSYEEKYAQTSTTLTHVVAPNVPEVLQNEIMLLAKRAFLKLGLRHLSRIDFFLTQERLVLLNEPNTFPGHTTISMFPAMMKNKGVAYKDFLLDIIERETKV